MALVPCPECARHVRVEAGGCPFCGHALSAPPSARARVGVMIGVAAISTLSACGRMAVKYGAPPAPPMEENATGVEAAGEPEGGEAAGEGEDAGGGEAPGDGG